VFRRQQFPFSAEAATGEIRTDVPIVVEEQGKHSLRAHMGTGGGRVDIHTVSGEIRVSARNDLPRQASSRTSKKTILELATFVR